MTSTTKPTTTASTESPEPARPDVDAMLAALTAARLPLVHDHAKTDGIRIRIAGRFVADHATTVLIWRPDGRGWYLWPTEPDESADYYAGREYLADGTPEQIAASLTELLDYTPTAATTTPALPGVTGPLQAAGWVLDAITDMADGTTVHGYLHPTGREITVAARPNGDHTLAVTGLNVDQVLGAVTGAGLTPTTPTPDLLAAVRAVIDAGHLEWGTGVDVDRVQGEAHSRLVVAYQAATGGAR